MGPIQPRRSSPEERGLKFGHTDIKVTLNTSLLTRGAWIEINMMMSVGEAKKRRSSPEERGLKW